MIMPQDKIAWVPYDPDHIRVGATVKLRNRRQRPVILVTEDHVVLAGMTEIGIVYDRQTGRRSKYTTGHDDIRRVQKTE